MRGRKVGQIDITIEEMDKICSMTQDGGFTRREIAVEVNRSANTVWRYQKMFGFL